MVGETGSGKTTLINAIINYTLGVEWKDDHRFQLVAESSGKSQAHSQTTLVTPYQFYHEEEFQIPYSITIIDTPGFGDTRGIEYDKEIMQQVRSFFANCEFAEIDAVCFVVRSSLARLTATQIYIFDSILSMFGKDIKDNIVFFMTFADSTKPAALLAITEAAIPCAQTIDGQPVHFKVNNCMLYSNNCPGDDDDDDDDDGCMMDEVQWRFSMRSIGKFLKVVLPSLTSKGLSLTKNVLKETNSLDVILKGVTGKLDEMMIKQHAVEETERVLRERWADIEKNQDLEFVVKHVKKIKIESDNKSTNCRVCEFTCHQKCMVILNLVHWCEVFDRDRSVLNFLTNQGFFHNLQCKVCYHVHECHSSDNFYWENVVETRIRTYREVKEMYEKKDEKLLTNNEILKRLRDDIEKFDTEVKRLIEEATKSIKRLHEIGLRPTPLSIVDYINLQIEKEKREGKSGFLERIKVLEKNKKTFMQIVDNKSHQDGEVTSK
ncbi:uncharacterized protein PAF06_013154 [Gastrophryne carolinensis]